MMRASLHRRFFALGKKAYSAIMPVATSLHGKTEGVPGIHEALGIFLSGARKIASQRTLAYFENTKKELNAVSPSFCLAKWQQVTLHLQNGQTHSCHHPTAHSIPLKELEGNPSALHNTGFKKAQRKLMLEGQRPAECDYCWNIEDAPGEHISDRYVKSADEWARPHLESTRTLPWNADVTPSYVEVNFGSLCNFKCAYCPPHINSGTLDEIQKHGPYPTSDRLHNIDFMREEGLLELREREENPYVASFWKWWPELYPKLHTFRITGGEPLINENTYRVLDEIARNPRQDLTLGINTNLGISSRHLERFLKVAERITANNLIRELRLFTSVDTWGARAEYVRHGLDYEAFLHNIDRVCTSLPNVKITIMVTFNALSVTSFREFLEQVLELKERHGTVGGKDRITLGISYLRHPAPMSVQVLGEEEKMRIGETLAYMKTARSKTQKVGFLYSEIEQMHRIHDWSKRPVDPLWLQRARSDFYLFFREYDRRRGTDFLKTFPEMTAFWELCKSSATQSQPEA